MIGGMGYRTVQSLQYSPGLFVSVIPLVHESKGLALPLLFFLSSYLLFLSLFSFLIFHFFFQFLSPFPSLLLSFPSPFPSFLFFLPKAELVTKTACQGDEKNRANKQIRGDLYIPTRSSTGTSLQLPAIST